MSTLPSWLANLSVGDLVLMVAFLSALLVVVRKGLKAATAWKDRWDDVFGEPARPGVAARPGLREEMASIKTIAEQAAADAADASKNTKPNGGRSSHDLVMAQFEEIRTQQTHIDQRLEEHITASEPMIADHAVIHDRINEVTEALQAQGAIVANLAEALPIVARSTPPDPDNGG